MELLPEQHAVTNVEVNELLRSRRHARWLSGQHTKKREGHHTSNKEARWLEAKVCTNENRCHPCGPKCSCPQVMKYFDSQQTAQQTRASVAASISALRPPQLETAAGDELSEAEQLAIVNLPATTLIDLHLVVEDAVGRLGGEDAATALVDILNERLFEPQAGAADGWNNPHGAVPSTSAASAGGGTSGTTGSPLEDVFAEDEAADGDGADAAPKRKGRRKRPRKR